MVYGFRNVSRYTKSKAFSRQKETEKGVATVWNHVHITGYITGHLCCYNKHF